MDGPRVVYSTDGNGVYVWNVQSGATVMVRMPSPSNLPLIGQVAIAGQRVAWNTDDVAGNSMETNEDLFTASIGKAGKRKLAHAFRRWDFDYFGMSGDCEAPGPVPQPADWRAPGPEPTSRQTLLVSRKDSQRHPKVAARWLLRLAHLRGRPRGAGAPGPLQRLLR
jgi:hypothetical protein